MPNTYLTASYAEKESVKRLGARFDPVRKMWYAPAGVNLSPFQQWLPAGALNEASTEASEQSSIHLLDMHSKASETKGVSLSELMVSLSAAVKQAHPSGAWVRVEVTSIKPFRGGLGLELVEIGPQRTSVAQARGVIWQRVADLILPKFQDATGMTLAPGIKLLLHVRPELHEQYGLSLFVNEIDPEYTLGDLEARKREIRAQLQAEGLWSANRQLAIPWDYRAVLVIAPTGAAGLGDFRVEADRMSDAGVCDFVYLNSRFQGEGAASEIRQTLLTGVAQWISDRPDVPDAVVIIRGGGAVNDLAWLNSYELARAVCELPYPVHTGIGHERDTTILDEIANLRFDTPSKVILGINHVVAQRCAEVQNAYEQILKVAQRAASQRGRLLDGLEKSVTDQARRCIAVARTKAKELVTEGRGRVNSVISLAHLNIESTFSNVQRTARGHLSDAKQKVPSLRQSIEIRSLNTVGRARSSVGAYLSAVLDNSRSAAGLCEMQVISTWINIQQDSQRCLSAAATNTESLFREVTGQGPIRTLKRGFALVRSTSGLPVTHANEITEQDTLNIQFAHGSVQINVISSKMISLDEKDTDGQSKEG